MSLLSVSRGGISFQRTAAARSVLSNCITWESVRCKSTGAPPNQMSQPGYLTKRKEKEVVTKWRKKLPFFKALPVNQLADEVYTGSTAIDVPDFRDSVGRRPEMIGKPVKFVPSENGPRRIFGLPKSLLLEFRLLSNSYSVIRQVTKHALDRLEDGRQASSLDNRWVFTGRPGCGKSFLLLQLVEHAIQSNWIVVYIPRAVDLVNSTTSFAYDIRTQTYLQPRFSFQTLQRMLSVNKKALEGIPLLNDIVLEKQTIPAGTTLTKAIGIAITERTQTGSATSSPAILDGVMKALDAQNKYPVLLAVDQLQALYGQTWYRDPHFVPIHSYHLSMPRLIMEYACGRRSFARGAFVGAISCTQSTNPVPIELRDTLELNELDTQFITEYNKRNQIMAEYTRGLKKFEVPDKLTLEEAVGIFEIWKGQQVFGSDQTFYDEMFLGKYTESGGNPREFVWNGILANLAA